ncbi:3,4-dihydroxyphenylacetaldehyde synthase 2-like [Condylostylus longicornis]|uniref:3,4-dihydroxyphenylacetaldehyde synthase 2-like n=1 Tax=Condylostylus longicornis TaxID=2530218 RepID=UPI00244E2421|nr:3,4-dihydroxyphenylacetaldehyde synthase 2-like [Condylostylus longicornis]
MDPNEFREFGKATVDFIADYLENIRDRDVLPSVSPGYLHDLLPTEVPENAENWKDVLKDIEKFIIPGITHWQSPNFHAYYPTATSFPSVVGEMLSAGFGVVGFSWICSPACTELESIVMDWVGRFLNLPEKFLNTADGPGGGVIQGSASEAILVAILAAREKSIKKIQIQNPDLTEGEIRAKLIAYSSDQSNSCVEKAGLLAAVPVRLLPTGDDLILTGDIIRKAIEEDLENGKIPIICIATLGTTGTCAYDDIVSLSKICEEHDIWLHVDAAYAAATLILPEFKFPYKEGLETVDSINYNLHKSMMVNFDCCGMWLKNAGDIVDNFNVDRIYLKHSFENQSKKAPDYRHWQIPLGRRFRALKVWITLRTIGAEGIRNSVRKRIKLAEYFEKLIMKDSRFEIVAERTFGLVCFKLKGENDLNKKLLDKLMERKKIYLIQAQHRGESFLRFVICGFDPQEKDIDFAWNEIKEQTDLLLASHPRYTEIECRPNDEKIINEISKSLQKHLLIENGGKGKQ